MPIEIKFRVQGDHEEYDTPEEVVNRAAYLSQNDYGKHYTIERGVKYSHKKDFRWNAMTRITLPYDVTENGPIAIYDDGVRDHSIIDRGLSRGDNPPYDDRHDGRFYVGI